MAYEVHPNGEVTEIKKIVRFSTTESGTKTRYKKIINEIDYRFGFRPRFGRRQSADTLGMLKSATQAYSWICIRYCVHNISFFIWQKLERRLQYFFPGVTRFHAIAVVVHLSASVFWEFLGHSVSAKRLNASWVQRDEWQQRETVAHSIPIFYIYPTIYIYICTFLVVHNSVKA